MECLNEMFNAVMKKSMFCTSINLNNLKFNKILGHLLSFVRYKVVNNFAFFQHIVRKPRQSYSVK